MEANNSRRIAIIVMSILTVVLGVVAIVLGLRIQQSQAPDDSSAASGSSSTTTTTTTSTSSSSSGGQCAGGGASCESQSCCGGLVCQGIEGSRRCEDPGTEDQCPGGGTCTAYISFKCNNLTNGQCLENPINGNNPSYAAGCGQIDQVCAGGTRDRQLCGNFTIYNSTCGQTSSSSSSSSSSTSTTGVVTGRQCGQTCSPSATCSNGHTCSGGICKLNACLTPGVCSDNACNLISCGNGVADQYEECGEPGLSCSGGAQCNTDFCLCFNNQCGDVCGSNADCPNGHTCSGNICKLNTCLTPGNCVDNACIPTLPVTALISDEVDRVLISLAVLVLGYVMIKYKFIDSMWLEFSGWANQEIKTDRQKSSVKKSQQQFEDKFKD
jgi:hypothetical protein